MNASMSYRFSTKNLILNENDNNDNDDDDNENKQKIFFGNI